MPEQPKQQPKRQDPNRANSNHQNLTALSRQISTVGQYFNLIDLSQDFRAKQFSPKTLIQITIAAIWLFALSYFVGNAITDKEPRSTLICIDYLATELELVDVPIGAIEIAKNLAVKTNTCIYKAEFERSDNLYELAMHDRLGNQPEYEIEIEKDSLAILAIERDVNFLEYKYIPDLVAKAINENCQNRDNSSLDIEMIAKLPTQPDLSSAMVGANIWYEVECLDQAGQPQEFEINSLAS
jgi:hypothetical protein